MQSGFGGGYIENARLAAAIKPLVQNQIDRMDDSPT
jgi:hypothetical protein